MILGKYPYRQEKSPLGPWGEATQIFRSSLPRAGVYDYTEPR